MTIPMNQILESRRLFDRRRQGSLQRISRAAILLLAIGLTACGTGGEPNRDASAGAGEDSAEETRMGGVLDAASDDEQPSTQEDVAMADADLEIVDILPLDGIPAIDRPEFWTVDEADLRYEEDELVLGVAFDGDARAYSIPFLSRHEIVNDTVGGRVISVTW